MPEAQEPLGNRNTFLNKAQTLSHAVLMQAFDNLRLHGSLRKRDFISVLWKFGSNIAWSATMINIKFCL